MQDSPPPNFYCLCGRLVLSESSLVFNYFRYWNYCSYQSLHYLFIYFQKFIEDLDGLKDSLQLHHDFIPKQLSKVYIFDQRQLLDPQDVEGRWYGTCPTME